MKMNVGPACLALIYTLISFPPQLSAQSTPEADQIRQQRESNADFRPEDFKPHMLDHPYAGCPVNSACTEELGQKRERFNQELAGAKLEDANAINLFLKKNFLPMPIFVVGSGTENYGDRNFILWDSSCREHQTPGRSVYLAEALVAKMTELDAFPQAISGLVLRQNGTRIESYRTPRDHAPRFMNGSEMIFLLEEDGRYYNLSLSESGKITALPAPTHTQTPLPASCSPELEAHFSALPEREKLAFHHHFCRSVYNLKSKTRETLLVAWSCK